MNGAAPADYLDRAAGGRHGPYRRRSRREPRPPAGQFPPTALARSCAHLSSFMRALGHPFSRAAVLSFSRSLVHARRQARGL